MDSQNLSDMELKPSSEERRRTDIYVSPDCMRNTKLNTFPAHSHDSKSSVLLRATEDGNLERVKSLCRDGADINTVDKYGNSALMIASAKGDLRLVRWLCENGADVNLRADDGSMAVLKAARVDRGDIVNLLFKHDVHCSYPASHTLKRDISASAKPWPSQPLEDLPVPPTVSGPPSEGPPIPSVQFSAPSTSSSEEIPTSMTYDSPVRDEPWTISSGDVVHSEETGGSCQGNGDEDTTIPKQIYTEDETSVKQIYTTEEDQTSVKQTYTTEEEQTFMKQTDIDSEETEDEEDVDLGDDNVEDPEGEEEEKPC